MPKFVSCVRCKVKNGHRDKFLQILEGFELPPGALNHTAVETGDHSYCTFITWRDENDLISARPALIAFLDTMRELLEELSPELGVTDPVSGPVIFQSS